MHLINGIEVHSVTGADYFGLAFVVALVIWGMIKMKWPDITWSSDAGWMADEQARPSRGYLVLQKFKGAFYLTAGLGIAVYGLFFRK